MGLLADWLGPVSLAEFRRTSFGKVPFARPSDARSILAACTWASLDAILRREPAADVLVVSGGKAVDVPAPRSLAELAALFERGIGIVVRDAEHVDAELHEVTRRLLDDVPGRPRVLVFATPAGRHGFGWHYDAEEVFIVQTEGEKEYLMQANTVIARPLRMERPDFELHRRERSPRMSCVLVPGDWLYVPAGHWHVALPRAHSLSISIGVFPT